MAIQGFLHHKKQNDLPTTTTKRLQIDPFQIKVAPFTFPPAVQTLLSEAKVFSLVYYLKQFAHETY